VYLSSRLISVASQEASYVRALNAAPSAKPSLGPSVPPSRGPGEGGGVLEETRRRNVELEEKVKALQAEGQEAKAKVQVGREHGGGEMVGRRPQGDNAGNCRGRTAY